MPAGSGTARLERVPRTYWWATRSAGLLLVLHGVLSGSAHPEELTAGAFLLGMDKVV